MLISIVPSTDLCGTPQAIFQGDLQWSQSSPFDTCCVGSHASGNGYLHKTHKPST